MIFGDVKPKGRLLGCEQVVVIGWNGQERAPTKIALLTSSAEADARVTLYMSL